MPSNSDLKASLGAAARKAAGGIARAQAGAPPPGGPQGVFDVSNDGTTWHPAVRLRASTGTAFTIDNGEVSIVSDGSGVVLEFANVTAFRASVPLADGTVFRIVSPPGEFRYSTTSGAGWADDGRTILKPTSVALGSNGRAFSTSAGATCPTFDALRGLFSGYQDHVHLQSHTTFGDGGGGIFDRVAVGSHVDDGGTVAVAGAYAYVRRDAGKGYTEACWWGLDPRNDGSIVNVAPLLAAIANLGSTGGVVRFKGKVKPSGTITISTKIALEGYGASSFPTVDGASVIVVPDGAAYDVLDVRLQGVELRNFEVKGNIDGASVPLNTAVGIAVNANGVKLDHVSVFRCGGDGIWPGKAANANSWSLVGCSTVNNGRDGLHVENASDANAGHASGLTSQFNARHGVYDNNGANTYTACTIELNLAWGYYFDAIGNTSKVVGGDTEANALGDRYVHPDQLYPDSSIAYNDNRRYTPTVNSATPYVGNGKHWECANTNPTTLTNFLGHVGHEFTLYLDSKTSVQNNSNIHLAGDADVLAGENTTTGLRAIRFKKRHAGSDIFSQGPWEEIGRNFEVPKNEYHRLIWGWGCTAIQAIGAAPLVYMPLRNSLRNGGSLAGALSVTGNPLLTSTGLSFDGVDDGAYLETGSLAAFTLIAKIQTSATYTGGNSGAIVQVDNSMPGVTTGIKGWSVADYTSLFQLVTNGYGRQSTGVAHNTATHVVAMTRDAGTGAHLRFDGAAAVSQASPGVAGTALVLGADYTTGWSNFTNCKVSNLMLFGSVLSTPQIQTLETWAAL